MKIPSFFLTFFIFITTPLLYPQDTQNLTTLDGKNFTEVKINRVEGDKIIISHTNGVTSLDLRVLPSEFRKKLGLHPSFNEVKRLYMGKVKSWNRSYETLNDQYDLALKRLESKFLAENKLQETLEVKKEREAFRKTMRTPNSNNKELSSLSKIYETSKKQWALKNSEKLLPITIEYLTDLNAVCTHLTKSGKLEQATVARMEFDRLNAIARDSEKIQMALGIGPAVADAQVEAQALYPDGAPKTKKSGTMFVLRTSNSATLPSREQCQDVVELHGNWETWAALKKDGSLISSDLNGQAIPKNHKPVAWFRVGSGMVTAFHPDGSYSVFGGGASPRDHPPEDLNSISQFALGRGSGIALTTSGKVRVWGEMYPNKSDQKEIEDQLNNIQFIGASEGIGWAVNSEGSVFSWKNGEPPQIIGNHNNIASFCGGRIAYLILTKDGNLEGGFVAGKNPALYVPENRRSGKSIRVNYWGYAIQFKDDSWFTWGGPPESASIHKQVKGSGALLDLEISGAPNGFLLMGLKR